MRDWLASLVCYFRGHKVALEDTGEEVYQACQRCPWVRKIHTYWIWED